MSSCKHIVVWPGQPRHDLPTVIRQAVRSELSQQDRSSTSSTSPGPAHPFHYALPVDSIMFGIWQSGH